MAISGNLSTGEATGAHLTGAREQGLYTGLGLLFMSVNRKLITKTIASVNLTHYIYYIHQNKHLLNEEKHHIYKLSLPLLYFLAGEI